MIQILLVHNEFNSLEPVTYLSYMIRVGTCSKWNHIAIRIDDDVIEAIGKGVVKSSYEEWLARSNRQVLPLIPNTEVYPELVYNTVDLNYSIPDLWERVKAIKAERWNGKTYEAKDYKGVICSDLACILLGIPPTLMPSDFEHIPYLTKLPVYRTYKNHI